MPRIRKSLFLIASTALFGASLAGAAFFFTAPSEITGTAPKTTRLDDYFFQSDLEYLTYSHDVYQFSFDVPEDFLVSNFEEGGKEIILAEHPQLHAGFQMVISPVEENLPAMTKELILQDDPSIHINDAVEFLLRDDISAIRFSSRDPSLGETRELWFIRNGHLYQVRMYAEDETWLDPWIRELASRLTFDDPSADPGLEAL